MSQWVFVKLWIGLLDSLYRHRKYSEDIYITIFSKFLKFFAIVFSKLFVHFLVFKGKNIALGLNASRVLAMSIFLFSFDSFNFSVFGDDFVVFWLALFNWSGDQVEYVWTFLLILWIVFQDLSCYVLLIRRHDFCYDHMTSQSVFVHSFMQFQLNCMCDVIFRS